MRKPRWCAAVLLAHAMLAERVRRVAASAQGHVAGVLLHTDATMADAPDRKTRRSARR